MTGHDKHTDYHGAQRHDRMLRELEHDPYHSKRKLTEPTVCRDCGAVYHKGRWSMGPAPAGAHQDLCPACHRIHDHVPAGYLTLSGDFFLAHKDEILHLARNIEQRERQEHPLKRIMNVEERPDSVEITFTDGHLTHGVAHAIEHAYKGELNCKYSSEDVMIHATWHR